MRVLVFPADMGGCGYFRMIWPAQALIAQGHDVRITEPRKRDIPLYFKDDTLYDVGISTDDADVIVFQRTTHKFMAQAVPVLRAKGLAVVVDIDDDLSAIHPRNPAYDSMHPRHTKEPHDRDKPPHSWLYLQQACKDATLVTVSTPGLLPVYAAHGRGRVLYNHLPENYFGVPHTDSDVIGWPAYLPSHPDDPGVTGGAIARLVSDGADFRITGNPAGCGVAFGLTADPAGSLASILPSQWPAAVAQLGIGIVPLADTRFNAKKSWLKGLELSALGVPWVASPRAEYRRLHARGAGLLADNPRRWYQRLNMLRNDEKARSDLADRGREAVSGLRIEREAWRWMEAWSDALRIQHGQPGVELVAASMAKRR